MGVRSRYAIIRAVDRVWYREEEILLRALWTSSSGSGIAKTKHTGNE